MFNWFKHGPVHNPEPPPVSPYQALRGIGPLLIGGFGTKSKELERLTALQNQYVDRFHNSYYDLAEMIKYLFVRDLALNELIISLNKRIKELEAKNV